MNAETDTGRPLTLRGRALLGTSLVPATVVIEDGRIAHVSRETEAGASPGAIETEIIAPGFVDLQVNGGFGHDVGDDPGAIRGLAARLPETGVTSFLPTLITSPASFYAAAFNAFEIARDATGARVLGLHLEGPFLSPKRPGAHSVHLMESAQPELLDELIDHDALRLMTLAPERPGALEWIRRLRERGVLVSLGHTDASFEQFEAGVDAGATMATHLFNAMSPFGHRAPNVIGASLVDDRVTVGLIADGVHCHPSAIELTLRAKGAERIALITDMVSAAGMAAGSYRLGGREVHLRDGVVSLADGTLAGSALVMDQAVRNVVRWTSASIPQALRMASEIPARLLGLRNTGRIEVGLDANLVLLGGDLRVRGTLVRGLWAFRR
ncbi:MAG: N-acetylglucosamine-6-phosphate deacetylase [Chloroflexota bacterium]